MGVPVRTEFKYLSIPIFADQPESLPSVVLLLSTDDPNAVIVVDVE